MEMYGLVGTCKIPHRTDHNKNHDKNINNYYLFNNHRVNSFCQKNYLFWFGLLCDPGKRTLLGNLLSIIVGLDYRWIVANFRGLAHPSTISNFVCILNTNERAE